MMRIGIAKGRGFAECAALLQDGGVDLPADFLRERLTVAEAEVEAEIGPFGILLR